MSLIGIAQPSITAFSPSSGPVGTTVTISGTGFSATPTSDIVFFGGVRARVITASIAALTVTVPVGATFQPISVSVGKLTGFSAAPFIVTFPGGQPFTALTGTSEQGAFDPEIDSSCGLHPNAVAVADFDGDGKLDVAAADNYSELVGTGAISIFQNAGSTGKIAFAPYFDIPTGFQAYAIAEGDLDGDGKPDLVCTSVINQGISVYQNTSNPGSITFLPATNYSSGQDPFAVAIADLDGDGKPDVIVANYTSGTISVYKNISTGTTISLAPRVDLTVGLGPQGLGAADLDGDGKIDLVISNGLSNTISMLRNTSSVGTIAFATPGTLTTGAGPNGIALGDLDGDGKADVVVVNSGANDVSIFQNEGIPGNLSFGTRIDYPCAASPYGVALADLNGDGKPDIYCSGQNAAVIQNGSTPGSIALSGQIRLYNLASAYGIGIGDLDGDGMNDLIEPAFTAHLIAWLRNKDNEPMIVNVSPTEATPGTLVTVSGRHFDGVTAVSFGGTTAASFTIINADTILATVGTGSSGNVGVTNQYGTNNMPGFVFHGPPTITRFTPGKAGNGDTIQLYGTSFTGATAVSFGGMAATSFVVITDTSITAVVDSGSSGTIAVTGPYGSGTIGSFQYFHIPVISQFTPTNGGIGTTVTITGAYFDEVSAVTFGGAAPASFTVNTPNSITAVISEGASGYVIVTSPGGTALSDTTFTFPLPVINPSTPDSAVIGSSIVIQGANFRSDTAADVVYFGAARALVTAATTSSLTVTVPQGATYQPLSVIVNNRVATTPKPFIAPSGNPGSAFKDNSFTWRGAFPAYNAYQLTLADLDGDGKSDLVALAGVESGSTTVDVNVLQNTSTINHPNFVTATTLVTSIGVNSCLSVGDINGDGKLDIVMSRSGAVSVYVNTSTRGQISFAAPQTIPITAYETAGLTLADVDGDGRLDVIMTTSTFAAASTTLSIYRNTGDGQVISFAPPVGYGTTDYCYQVRAADFDNDGQIDIAAVAPEAIHVFRNSSTPGNIAFATAGTYTTNLSQQFAVADADGDGLQDLISVGAAGTYTYYLSILKNNSTSGNISFAAKIDSPYVDYNGIDYFGPQAGLIDGDGKPDVLVPGSNAYANGPFSLYRNTGTGGGISYTTGGHYTIPLGFQFSTSGTIGDIDGDGKADIVVSNEVDNVVSVFRNQIGEQVLTVCAHADTFITAARAGSTYQWQIAGSSGFVNLGASAVFTGVNTATLSLHGILDSLNNAQLRCLVDGAPLNVTDIVVQPDTLLVGTLSVPLRACYGDIVSVTFTPGATVPNGTVVRCWCSRDQAPYSVVSEQTNAGVPLQFLVADSAHRVLACFVELLPDAGSSGCAIGGYSDTAETATTQLSTPLVSRTGNVLQVTSVIAGATYTWQQLDSTGKWTSALTRNTDTLISSGTYRVQEVDSSCTVYSDTLTYTKPITTNTTPSDSSGAIISYPNPTTGTFVIDSLSLSDAWTKLELLDGQTGRRISITQVANQTRIVLSVANLNNGLYVVILRNSRGDRRVIRLLKL
jgi:hypothetical protein